ncbi:MAG: divalent cation tolerance protein CutA, partial [Arcobacter sp.]
MKAIIVQTTCSSKEEAKNIAKVLIEEKLAACVQLSEIESFYNWKEEFCCDNETLLNIKY